MTARVEKEITMLLEELLDSEDYDAAIECFAKICAPPNYNYLLVTQTISVFVERAPASLLVGCTFLMKCKEKSLLTTPDYERGYARPLSYLTSTRLSETLRSLTGLSIDYPKIFTPLAELISEGMKHNCLYPDFVCNYVTFDIIGDAVIVDKLKTAIERGSK